MMDATQIKVAVDYMVGGQAINGRTGAVETPHNPELRAFIVARLGSLTPASGYSVNSKAMFAFADFLRELADGLDRIHRRETPTP